MSGITAQTIIDAAQSRHPLFMASRIPDGAALAYMVARQRSLLLLYGGAIDGLVSISIDVATTIANTLVGSASGVPVYLTTYEDGWATHKTAANVPYWDFSEPKIAGDPFGENGGVPGFPLPDDFLRLILITCTYADSEQVRPVDVIAEVTRLARQRPSVPTAFVSGNRLVPVRPLASGNTSDLWSNVAAVQLSYVPSPTLTALTDTISVPAPLTEALIAGLAEYMAGMTPGLSPGDKRAFAETARLMESALGDFSVDVVGAATPVSVRYRR